MHGDVIDIRRVAPRTIRVLLGGDGLDGYEPTPFTDQYVNVLVVPPGAPYEAPFDLDEARRSAPEHRPMGRRYTIRSWDPVERVVAIDFVVHGDVGVAGRWANNARVGDVLQFVGPSGGYAPDDSRGLVPDGGRRERDRGDRGGPGTHPSRGAGVGRPGRRRRRQRDGTRLRGRPEDPLGASRSHAGRGGRGAGGRAAPFPRGSPRRVRPRRGRRGGALCASISSPHAAWRARAPRSRPTGDATSPTRHGAR